MEHGAELDSSSLRPHEGDVKTNQPSVASSDIQEEVEQVTQRLCCRQTTTCRFALALYFISSVRLCVWRRGRERAQAGSASCGQRRKHDAGSGLCCSAGGALIVVDQSRRASQSNPGDTFFK